MDIRAELSNPETVAAKLSLLSELLGLSSECIAQARRLLDIKMAAIIKSPYMEKYGATERKIIIQSECADEIYLVNYSEAINKDLHYCIESTRTLISYLKEELKKI